MGHTEWIAIGIGSFLINAVSFRNMYYLRNTSTGKKFSFVLGNKPGRIMLLIPPVGFVLYFAMLFFHFGWSITNFINSK